MARASGKSPKGVRPLPPPSHRRLFLVITFLTPPVFFLLLEGFLRLTAYGPDLSLFTTESIGGRTYYVMNPDVKSRYFSRVAFSPSTSLDCFELPKPRGTFRIVCLGGSTTVGFPYGYAYAFPTLIKDRLSHIFPERRFDAINLGMTATNSFTAADIISELPAIEADLIIIYDGHNEFYGALGAASAESIGRSRWLGKLYLRAVHWKTFLLLRHLYNTTRGAFRSGSETPGGTLMERLARGQYVLYGSPLYEAARENFRANLRELTGTAVAHGIPVILGTQVSNLRDMPPFVSSHPDNLPVERRAAFAAAMNNGIASRLDGDVAGSLTFFHEAREIDSMRADVHYEIARALELSGNAEAAHREYVLARDLDQLRFRASTDFNEEIVAAAQVPGVYIADIEQGFAKASPHGEIGSSLMMDHLHPNVAGYFLMAKEFARTMRSAGIFAPPDEWATRDTVSDDALRSVAALTEVDSMAAALRIEFLTSGWPFRDNGAPTMHPDMKSGLGAIVERLVYGRSTWEEAHVAAAEYYRTRGDSARVERELRTLIRIIPLGVSAYLLLAQLYAAEGRKDDASSVLRTSLNVEPTLYACSTLGSLEALAGRYANAVPLFEQAVELSTTQAQRNEHQYFLASVLRRSGDPRRAIVELRQILASDPGYVPARDLLRLLTERAQ